MPPMTNVTPEQMARVDKVREILGIADDVQFLAITWASFNDAEIDDWHAGALVLTPDADPFLARAAVLTLSQDVLEVNFARVKK